MLYSKYNGVVVSLGIFLNSQGTLLVKAYSLTNLTVKARDIKSIATLESEFVRFSVHNSEIWVVHFFIAKRRD